jgi:hypothetical protein
MPEPDFDKRGGLLPAIAQDVRTGQVLMVAYMNREAWRRTLETGRATYWSTSRNALWAKGESSGHVQHVREISSTATRTRSCSASSRWAASPATRGMRAASSGAPRPTAGNVIAARLEAPSAG